VDRAVEETIARILLQGAPGSVVLGEELSPEATSAELLWVVDPLDGTTNYLHGYPAYGVSIAAVADGRLTAAVVIDVDRDREYYATAGEGAWSGEHRLAVSTVDDPSLALIGTGFPFKWPELVPRYLRQFAKILPATSGIRRAGAASLDFVDIALGRFEGFWELMLAPWDVAAGTLIVREAGGVVTDLAGSDDFLRHGAFVAGNPAIHEWLLEVLQDE
jgi:myo-inositol-1(or 4)-monophosphatase